MTGRFTGRTCLVTGGTRGIGRDIAHRLVQEGADVTITGRSTGPLDDAVRELKGAGPGSAHGIRCDLADSGSVRALAGEALERYGRVDVLVNNAGTATLHRFTDVPEPDLDAVWAVNVRGAFLLTQLLVPAMAAAGDGSVVNVSSQAAVQGQALISHYAATKAALLGLTRCLAVELAPAVRVNAVCPGIVETDMIAEDFRRQGDLLGTAADAVRDTTLAGIPLGRFQRGAGVASAVAFLASRDAADVTGQTWHVDGGMTIGRRAPGHHGPDHRGGHATADLVQET
ncbi:SDR family NAD(P)-dependent oxidoreductase [Streptomyces sp. NPDC087300]|uniref:SDR family NAD(P)-dependent oxidoreductase n=1 Tax=Streptomyces sp. NPDC087300 TaxID=3365780 RepID=UPI0037F3A95D